MAQRSPFPGMDPWLEGHWGDFHHRIIQYSCDRIAPRLPTGLFAAVEETVYIGEPRADHAIYRPDVGVFDQETGEEGDGGQTAVATVAVAEPVRIRFVDQIVPEGHIQIRKIGGDEPLVTAIEVFSPTNKIDKRGRAAYVSKRKAYFDAGASLVEIDLLRAGDNLMKIEWDQLPPHLKTPYKACVRRANPVPSPEAEYYPFQLRQRLPAIRIPLRPTDPDLILDLQALIDEAYEKGRYAARLDYTKPPNPPLDADDASWAAQLLIS